MESGICDQIQILDLSLGTLTDAGIKEHLMLMEYDVPLEITNVVREGFKIWTSIIIIAQHIGSLG